VEEVVERSLMEDLLLVAEVQEDLEKINLQ
jgi:hypothetical protein